jgi:CBS domain-containing protein
MRCEEVMKREVECLSPQESVKSAARRMRDQNVGFLPVCDQAGKALGTLTDRDIVVRLAADDRPTSTPVEQIMTREVVACRPDDDIRNAERLMGEKQKSRIMVVDDAGGLVGVISLSDIAQLGQSARVAETMRQVTDREARSQ